MGRFMDINYTSRDCFIGGARPQTALWTIGGSQPSMCPRHSPDSSAFAVDGPESLLNPEPL